MLGADTIVIVGVDCAAQSERIGIARALLRGGECTLTDTAVGSTGIPVHEVIGQWLRGTTRGLIALDAPLGWPLLLAEMLSGHRAGERLVGRPDQLFHRHTDEFVRTSTGQKPLEVAADRIARTAHSSLDLLDRIRTHTGSEVPLAWSSDIGPGLHAIEVYPAATLVAHRLPSRQYKQPAETASRIRILDGLRDRIELVRHETLLASKADALDAAVCVLGALDFLAGDVMYPDVGDHIARKEGWIWVRKPTSIETS